MEDLYDALLSDDLDAVQLILTKHPQLINHDKSFQDGKLSPLCLAVRRSFTTKHTAVVKLLLDLGADIDVCNRQYIELTSETPLVTAARLGADLDPLLDILVQHEKVDHTLESRLSYTALYYAAKNGDVDLVRRLMNKGHDINWLCHGSNTALLAAAAEGHAPVIRFLLENEADVVPNDSKTSPLHAAAQGGHQAAVELLVDHGCDVNVKNISMVTPLHIAAELDNLETVKVLIKSGSNLNSLGSWNQSPLVCALLQAAERTVFLLIRHGADVSEQSDYHPLDCAYRTDGVGIKTWRALLLAGCYTSEDRHWFNLAKLNTDMIQSLQEFQIGCFGESEFEKRELRYDWLKQFLTTPLSLQDRCRMEIRKSIVACSGGRDIIPIVTSLPITRPVIRHLCFDT